MNRALQGRYVKVAVAGGAFKAFVPATLPRRPAIDWTPALRGRFDAALLALGRLDAVTELLPDAGLLLYSYVRKEAVLSSMIEGTQASLADLMLFELDEQPGVPVEDVREVSGYVAALEHGLERLLELASVDAQRIETLGRAASAWSLNSRESSAGGCSATRAMRTFSTKGWNCRPGPAGDESV